MLGYRTPILSPSFWPQQSQQSLSIEPFSDPHCVVHSRDSPTRLHRGLQLAKCVPYPHLSPTFLLCKWGRNDTHCKDESRNPREVRSLAPGHSAQKWGPGLFVCLVGFFGGPDLDLVSTWSDLRPELPSLPWGLLEPQGHCSRYRDGQRGLPRVGRSGLPTPGDHLRVQFENQHQVSDSDSILTVWN